MFYGKSVELLSEGEASGFGKKKNRWTIRMEKHPTDEDETLH